MRCVFPPYWKMRLIVASFRPVSVPRNFPTLGLITEVVIEDEGLLRGPLGRPYQQVRYFPLKHFVCWKSYGVADMPCLQVLVKLRLGKGGVGSKQKPHRHLHVALHDRLDEFLPAIGAMDLAWPENCSFTVSELVEAEQGVIAHVLEMSIVGYLFLIAMHLTL